MLERIDGGVTAARGFMAAGTEAGIKKSGRDMAMIASTVPFKVAGTFTSNVVKAATVLYDRQIVTERKTAQAVIVNSGVANACTGQEGLRIARESAKAAAEVLNKKKAAELGGHLESEDVLVASTGVIGVQIPLDKIIHGADLLADLIQPTRESGHEAALAIMTTDTRPKEAAVKMILSDGTEARIGGMCKGAGMIHPNMCTMLSFVTTDIAMDQTLLQEALRQDIVSTYNMVSVDGDTSTNDTCLVMANGLAGNKEITEKNEDYETFKAALHMVNEALAKMMAGDGEGATCLFEVRVNHADTLENARILARSVVSSSLVKAAIFGHDANWGRVVCALGYSGVDFDPEKVGLVFTSANGSITIAENGVTTDFDEDLATRVLTGDHITAICDMAMGEASAEAWGCDLTYDYVKINGDYRT